MNQDVNTEIEKAEPGHAPVVVDLLKRLYLELGEERESLNFLSTNLIERMLTSGATGIYLLRQAGQYIGVFTLTESQAIYAGGKYGVLDEMYIVPEQRRQKHGARILEYIGSIAKKNNWSRLDVTAPTEEKWSRTRRFYENNGFVFTGPKYKLKL